MNGWSLAGAALAPACDTCRTPRGEAAARRIGRRQVVAGLTVASALGALRMAPVAVADEGPLAEAYSLINAFREAHQRPPLLVSARLQAAAQAHADDMAHHDFVSHSSSDGTSAIDRIRRYYPYNTWIGENVAAGFTHAVAAVEGWQSSPRHRDGLLLPEFQAVGLGLAVNEQSRYRWYWVCDLGGAPDED